MCDNIFVDDIGTIFRGTVYDQDENVVNIASGVYTFTFKKPDGNIVSKSGTLYTDGSDGILQYSAESGLLNLKGKWQLQCLVQLPAGQWHTNVEDFTVKQNLE